MPKHKAIMMATRFYTVMGEPAYDIDFYRDDRTRIPEDVEAVLYKHFKGGFAVYNYSESAGLSLLHTIKTRLQAYGDVDVFIQDTKGVTRPLSAEYPYLSWLNE